MPTDDPRDAPDDDDGEARGQSLRGAKGSNNREKGGNAIPDDVADIINDLRGERDKRAREAEDQIQDERDKRQFRRNAGLALFLAIMWNNPSSWMKDLWAWILAHVSIH